MAIDQESTVFVVDDDPATRALVTASLKAKGIAVEEFPTADEFLRRYDPLQSGCLVVDLRMAEMSGLELLRSLKERNCPPPIIALASNPDVALAVQAMQAGALTLLEKRPGDQQLWDAMEQALEVEKTRYVQRRERTETEARLAMLTADELEVFRRLLAGHANKRIASDLDIGLRTVELRRSNIMKKMQATSLPDLVRMAILIDFLKPASPDL